MPKFAFGIKLNPKESALEVPGPGAYENDSIPLNQKKTAAVIGTDMRRDMSKPNAHEVPGPGHYETPQVTGPLVSFTQEKKKF